MSAKQVSRDHGQDLVEYALAAPILLLLMLGIMDFGILIFSYSTIASAAREGARAGVVTTNPACDSACRLSQADAAALNAASTLDPSRLTVSSQYVGTTIRVDITYNADLITGPVIAAVGGSSAVPLGAVAIMQRE